MTTIYCLMHSYDNSQGEAEEKVLGYFISKTEATNAIEPFRCLPGFRDHPGGFIVDGIELGRLFWEEGFETLLDNEPI